MNKKPKLGMKFKGCVTLVFDEETGDCKMSETCETAEEVLKKYPESSEAGIYEIEIKLKRCLLEPAIDSDG